MTATARANDRDARRAILAALEPTHAGDDCPHDYAMRETHWLPDPNAPDDFDYLIVACRGCGHIIIDGINGPLFA